MILDFLNVAFIIAAFVFTQPCGYIFNEKKIVELPVISFGIERDKLFTSEDIFVVNVLFASVNMSADFIPRLISFT